MKANTTLLSQLKSKRDQTVAEGRAAELREQDGYTNAVLINDAKSVLGIKEHDMISVEFEEIVKKQNLKVNAFINIVNARYSAEKIGLDSSIIESLKNGENQLAAEVAKLYDKDIEDLYEEGEE